MYLNDNGEKHKIQTNRYSLRIIILILIKNEINP